MKSLWFECRICDLTNDLTRMEYKELVQLAPGDSETDYSVVPRYTATVPVATSTASTSIVSEACKMFDGRGD